MCLCVSVSVYVSHKIQTVLHTPIDGPVRERECVCVRERVCVCVRERVCVCERESVCVCVFVSV